MAQSRRCPETGTGEDLLMKYLDHQFMKLYSPRCGNMNYGRRSECNKGCGFKKSDFSQMGMGFEASLGGFLVIMNFKCI